MSGMGRALRVADYVDHMLEAVRPARAYVAGTEKGDFLVDRKTQQAVIFNVFVIGEAATKLCNEHAEFVAAHSEIPWKQMRGMRNRMAHGYFEIDLDIVWDTVRQALPELEQQLGTLRQEFDPGA